MTEPITHPSVLVKFVDFSVPLEGEEFAPYLDVKGYPTVGIGCLIWSQGAAQPAALALGIDWVLPDGSTPTDAEVIRQITALHGMPALAHYSAKSQTVLNSTTIRLTKAGILKLVARRLAEDEPWLVRYLPGFATWPADAQMAAYSVAWAVGPGWPAIFTNAAHSLNGVPPRFLEAILHMPDANHPGQFLPAEITISSTGNAGVIPRNAQNELALSNAQIVQDRGLDRTVLHWPLSPLNDGSIPVANG